MKFIWYSQFNFLWLYRAFFCIIGKFYKLYEASGIFVIKCNNNGILVKHRWRQSKVNTGKELASLIRASANEQFRNESYANILLGFCKETSTKSDSENKRRKTETLDLFRYELYFKWMNVFWILRYNKRSVYTCLNVTFLYLIIIFLTLI